MTSEQRMGRRAWLPFTLSGALVLIAVAGLSWLYLGERPVEGTTPSGASVAYVALPPELDSSSASATASNGEAGGPSEDRRSESSPGASAQPDPPPDSAPPAGAAPAVSIALGRSLSPLDPALSESGPHGSLPRVSIDGRRSWRVYARPFDPADTRPRVAVMLVNLGLTESTTESAVERLPGEVSLAFSPYAGEQLQLWTERARARGHEILLALPMEPINYPANDPGPHTLLVAAPTRENLDRLGWVLSRASGYVGVASYMGSRFTTSAEALKPVFAELKKRGLMFVDSRAAARSAGAATSKELDLPYAANDRYLDVDVSREAIDARLREVELIARRKGIAVAIGFPHPVTIERLVLWAESLEAKGLALAPITAVARVKDGS